MLRFNTYKSKTYYLGCLFQYILCYGSTYTNLQNFLLYVGFQYILCYGSTPKLVINQFEVKKFQYILCYGSTHKRNNGINLLKIFQYILCYGSTFWEIFFQDMLKHYFNTSYVTVQRLYQSKHTFT